MSIKTTDLIQGQLLQVLAELPPIRQKEVLNFALFLSQQELIGRWNAISSEEAIAMKAEFADEDQAMAEAVLTDYLHMLQREDEM